MTATSLNITVVDKRMFNRTEAAGYTGLGIKLFQAICSVRPIEVRTNKLLWDKRDLDKWIDALKEGSEQTTRDSILADL